MRKPLPIRDASRSASLLASALHQRGLRFRKEAIELPGHPHLVFPRWRTALFVCDCHQYQHGCPNSQKWCFPDTHTRAKELAIFTQVLSFRGWTVETVWRCEISETFPVPSRVLDIFGLPAFHGTDG